MRIDLPASSRSTELRLTNTGAEELSVQVDVREWSQDFNGAEELVETRALLAVPPLVTIPPGERQIVRIGHLAEPALDVEKSFRVLVTELAPAAEAADRPALSMRLRLSIPVFVAPPKVRLRLRLRSTLSRRLPRARASLCTTSAMRTPRSSGSSSPVAANGALYHSKR